MAVFLASSVPSVFQVFWFCFSSAPPKNISAGSRFSLLGRGVWRSHRDNHGLLCVLGFSREDRIAGLGQLIEKGELVSRVSGPHGGAQLPHPIHNFRRGTWFFGS